MQEGPERLQDGLNQPLASEFSGRRQVTAMFSDIVGSVSLLDGMGPEEMSEVLAAYYGACEQVIRTCGGSITDYLGDGVLAYFGYPEADEDDPLNALRAALALRSAVARLDLPDGLALAIRIGVATGLVVVDAPPRGRGRRATLVGGAPNLATRLMGVAAANTIVVEPVTRRIGERLFRFREIGPMELKGFPQPVTVSELVGALPVVGRFGARRAHSAALIGRDSEVARALACWSRACAGEGNAVTVQGEAGIGKSRLAHAVQERARADGRHCVTWYCAPRRADSALHPVVDQLKRAARFSAEDDNAARLEKLEQFLSGHKITAPARKVLAHLLGLTLEGDPQWPKLTPERRREVTLESLLTLLDRANEGGPALFLVEDLHWADSTALELLNRAVILGAERPWLFVLTARPGFCHEWFGTPVPLTIMLEPLEDGDAVRICRTVDKDAVLPSDVLRQLVSRCGGNPLFLQEMTKSVVEAATTPGAGPRFPIPETLQALLVARLDRLGTLRRIVSLASVIGPRFDYDMLEAVTGLDGAALKPALYELARAGLIDSGGAPPQRMFQFRHAMIRDAAYDSLLKRERERLHGQIAGALRARFAHGRVPELEQLAYHLTESGAHAEAIPLWSEAARQSASRAAHNEAAAQLSSALRLLEALPLGRARSKTKLGLLLARAASLAAVRGYSAGEVEDAITEARRLSDTLGDAAERFAVLSACYGFSLVTGDMSAAQTLAGSCWAMAQQTGKPRHLTAGGSMLGFVLFAKGEFGAARVALEHAIGLYRTIAPFYLPQNAIQDPLIVCLAVSPLVSLALGDAAGAARVAEDLLVHARSLGRDYDLAYSLCWRALFEITRGMPGRARGFADEALAISASNDFRLWKAVSGLMLLFASVGGRPAGDAVARAKSFMTELDRIGLNLMRSFYWWQIALLELASGDVDGALVTIDQAVAFSQWHGERVLLSQLHGSRGEILFRLGREEDGETAVRLAREVAVAQGAVGFTS